jgi:ABC-type transporter Mla subunit MlaD
MAISRREKITVLAALGAAVLIGLAGPPAYRLAGHLIWPAKSYRAMFRSSVAGLEPGDAVEIKGVEVGRVVKVELTQDSPPRIAVDLEVAAKTPIRLDSIASVDISAKDGSKVVKISGGTAAAGALPAGQQIATEDVTEAELQTEDISRKAGDILAQLSGAEKPAPADRRSRDAGTNRYHQLNARQST